MRTVLLANNTLGARVARWLAGRDELVGLVLHRPERQTAVQDLADELGVPTWCYPDGLPEVRTLAPECLLSVLFGHIVPSDWLQVPTWRPLNLHPGLLPFNAGADPNVWPLVDGSPAGTTLHVMAETVDAGPTLIQRPVPVAPDDTAASLHQRLSDASFEMLEGCWESVQDLPLVPQSGDGTFHRRADLTTLDPSAADLPLVDRLRARTFPPYGAEFERDGQRWRIRVEIERVPEEPA